MTVTCQGCDHFQRSTPSSAIGQCGMHKVEVLETHPRECADRAVTVQYLQKYAKGPRRKAA